MLDRQQQHDAGVNLGPSSFSGPAKLGRRVCPLCGAQNSRAYFSKSAYTLCACPVCELFFIDPYPTSAYQYERVKTYDYDEIGLVDPETHYLNEVLYYRIHFPFIAEECSGARSLLDVGCGTGHLLERLAVFPDLFRAGIELNASRASYARRKSGCEIHEAPLESFPRDQKFDVLTMINVLSHVPSLDYLFNSVRCVLAPNGKLVLRTGEMSLRVNRWNQFNWGFPDHLQFLGLHTIEFISQKYKFRVIRHVRTPHSEEMFLPLRWGQPGRSRLRNAVKQAVGRLPFALSVAKGCYEVLAGKNVYLSFIVMTPQ